jgi:hypothetical protein
VAELRGEPLERVASVSLSSFRRLFRRRAGPPPEV